MSSEIDIRIQLTEAQLRAAINTVARDTLRPATLGIGLLYAVLSVSYLLRYSPEIARPMTAVGVITSAAFLTFYLMLRRRRFPVAWAHRTGVIIAYITLGNMVVQHWYARPAQYTNFVLLAVGSGFLVLDWRWLAAILGAEFVAWTWIIQRIYPSVKMADFLLQFLSTLTVTLIVHVVRVRTLRRFERLRLQDQNRKSELEKTVLALQHSESRFRTLSNATFEGVAFHDRGRLMDANQALLTMFGYELHEVIGRNVLDFVAPEVRAMIARRVVVWNDTPLESIGLKRDGTHFPIEVRGRTTAYQGGDLRMVAISDITERQKAEAALHVEQQRYRALFDRTNDAVFIIDLDNVYITANQRAAEMFGYSVEEIVGQAIPDFIVPEEVPDMQARRAALLAGEEVPVYERTFRRKDGTTFPAEINVALVYDAEGKPLHMHSIVRDVTERKRIEAEREQLIHDLEIFAQNVAHDLKNPLGLVMAYTGLIRDDAETLPVETTLEYLDEIAEGARKMAIIIQELLLLAQTRYGGIESTPLDMNPLVAAVCRRLAFTTAEYEGEIILPAQWPGAMGYGPWIEEVWYNYLSNALKYGGSPPRIELGAEAAPEGWVRYWVRDNGAGLTPEQQAQLFVPFTQLHQAHSRGHGLGLSIVHHIVEKLGGQVGVESVDGQGSLFYFTLPCVPPEASVTTGPTGPTESAI